MIPLSSTPPTRMTTFTLMMAKPIHLALTIYQLWIELFDRIAHVDRGGNTLVIWQKLVVEMRPLDSRCESADILGARKSLIWTCIWYLAPMLPYIGAKVAIFSEWERSGSSSVFDLLSSICTLFINVAPVYIPGHTNCLQFSGLEKRHPSLLDQADAKNTFKPLYAPFFLTNRNESTCFWDLAFKGSWTECSSNCSFEALNRQGSAWKGWVSRCTCIIENIKWYNPS